MAIALDPVEGYDLQTVLGGQFVQPFLDGRRFAKFRDLFEVLGEVRAVHDGDAGNVVAHARRVRVLTDVGTLADLLDDVFLDAELGAVEDLDLHLTAGFLLDSLGPVGEALVIWLLGTENVVELQHVFLCLRPGGNGRKRQNRRSRHRPGRCQELNLPHYLHVLILPSCAVARPLIFFLLRLLILHAKFQTKFLTQSFGSAIIVSLDETPPLNDYLEIARFRAFPASADNLADSRIFSRNRQASRPRRGMWSGCRRGGQPRVSGRYLIRCGWSASAPRRRRRSAS